MWTVMDSPIGELRIIEHNGAITAIEFTPFRRPPAVPAVNGPTTTRAG